MTDDFRGPAAREFDWPHILKGHTTAGSVAQQSGKKTVFVGSEAQIKARVRAAWRKRTRTKSQIDPFGVERIQYRSKMTRPDETIVFWYNTNTGIVETAYPESIHL